MKRTYNLLIIFFTIVLAFIFSFLSKTNFDGVQHSVNQTGYIQDIKQETVILLSNNTFKSNLSSRQKKNNNGFTNLYPIIIDLKATNNWVIADSQNYNEDYTYNSTNNTKNIHKIRAP